MSSEPTAPDTETQQDEFSNIPTDGHGNSIDNEAEDGPEVEIEDEEPKQHAGVVLLAAKVLTTVTVDEQTKAKSAEDKHAASAMKVGDQAAAYITSIGDSLSSTLRTNATILASDRSAKEGEKTETQIDETVSATATAGAAGIKAAATAANFASDMFRKLVVVAGTQASNQLYSRYPDTMRHPTTVKAKKVFVGYLLMIVTIISAIFDAVSKVVDGAKQWASELVGSKYGEAAKKLTRNVLTVLIYAFQLGLALSLMGFKGIIITFIIFFIVGTITKIEDPNEDAPKAS